MLSRGHGHNFRHPSNPRYTNGCKYGGPEGISPQVCWSSFSIPVVSPHVLVIR